MICLGFVFFLVFFGSFSSSFLFLSFCLMSVSLLTFESSRPFSSLFPFEQQRLCFPKRRETKEDKNKDKEEDVSKFLLFSFLGEFSHFRERESKKKPTTTNRAFQIVLFVCCPPIID